MSIVNAAREVAKSGGTTADLKKEQTDGKMTVCFLLFKMARDVIPLFCAVLNYTHGSPFMGLFSFCHLAEETPMAQAAKQH